VRRPYDEPGQATAERGEVQLDGPDGVAVSMTPEAARLTGESLIAAAAEARAQAAAEG
jgi:hypothetical protein